MMLQRASTFPTVADRTMPMGIAPTDTGQVALERAGLDWKVHTAPLSDLLPDARGAHSFVVARRSTDGAVLGVTSARFHQHQPATLARLGDEIVRIRRDARFVAGGTTPDLRVQFLVLSLPDPHPFPFEGGTTNRNVLLMNGTNGGTCLSGFAFNWRWRCMNQFPAIRRDGATLFRLGHTMTADTASEVAHRAITEATDQWEAHDDQVEELLKVSIPMSRQWEYAEAVVGPVDADNRAEVARHEQQVDRILSEWQADHNADIARTGWGLVMAAQAVDEHASRAANRDAQRMLRLARGHYPLMRRALELVG